MNQACSIHLLSTSMREGSASRALLLLLSEQLEELGVTVNFTDARMLPFVPCDGRDLQDYPVELQELAKQLRIADGVVIASPVHFYGTTGATKNLLEIVGESLTAKPLALVTAAGSTRSHLAIGSLILALMHEVDAVVFPTTVQVIDGATDDLDLRIKDLAVRFSQFSVALRPTA